MAENGDRSSLEEGLLSRVGVDQTPKPRRLNWLFLALNIVLATLGSIGGPLLIRLYYLHGGGSKWVASWLQNAGFPILFLPLCILRFRAGGGGGGEAFWAEPKLLLCSAGVGLLMGFDNFLYALGLSYLPVSTSSLLFSTQLAFTALFSLLLVKQPFAGSSVNAVVLMTLGAALLGCRKSGDRPAGVSESQYLLGFCLTLASAALLGFLLPCVEAAYSKARKAVTTAVVVQFQLGVTLFAAVVTTVGVLVNNDFAAMAAEGKQYGLGETKYYIVLAACAVFFQFMYVGMLGVLFCTSSLFSGVLTAALLPMTEVAAVLIYRESFTAEKGFSLALCLWGFASFFYGEYKNTRKQEKEVSSCS